MVRASTGANLFEMIFEVYVVGYLSNDYKFILPLLILMLSGYLLDLALLKDNLLYDF